MTSPLPPKRRDTKSLDDLVRHLRLNSKQLGVGQVDGRFPPAKPLGPAALEDDETEDDETGDTAAIAFHNTDAATAGATGIIALPLTYAPIDGSLHVYWNGVAIEPSAWSLAGQTITFVEHRIRTGARLHAEYAYYPSDAVVEIPDTPTLVFSDTDWDNDAFSFPAGANDGEFILAIAVLPPGASIADSNGYELIGVSEPVTHAAQSGTYTYHLEAWWIIKPVGAAPVPTLTTVALDTLTATLAFSGATEVYASQFDTVGDDDAAFAPAPSPRTDLRIYATVSNAAVLTADQGTEQFNLSGGVDSDVQLMVTSGDFTAAVRAETDGPMAGWMLAGVILG